MNGKMNAQTCCSAGAPVSSSFDLSNSSSGQLSFQLEYNFKQINRLVNVSDVLLNDPRTRSGSSALLKTAYGFNEKWSVGVVLPVVFQNRSTFSAEESSAGLGDLLLLGQYTHNIGDGLVGSFLLGVKLPTGTTGHLSAQNIFLSPDMQSGTGSFDYLSRVVLLKQNLLTRNLSGNISASYRRNTTNDDFASENGGLGRSFKFGDEWIAQIQFTYQLLAGTSFLLPDVGLKYRNQGANHEQDFPAANSGGFWLNLPFGLSFRPALVPLQVRIFAELPLYQKLEGLQISTSVELGIQLNYSLDFNKKKVKSIL